LTINDAAQGAEFLIEAQRVEPTVETQTFDRKQLTRKSQKVTGQNLQSTETTRRRFNISYP
jgi:hypothetical protein